MGVVCSGDGPVRGLRCEVGALKYDLCAEKKGICWMSSRGRDDLGFR
jgi:hypothetical protein